MNLRPSLCTAFALSWLCILAGHRAAEALVLVDDPFLIQPNGWFDPVPERGGDWRLSVYNPTLMETSDLVPVGSNPPAATNNGSYNPTLLIQDNFTSPATYDLNARMYSADDDGFGLVFGYQDPENYFRAFLRWQVNGNLGGTRGVSVQKVVNGVATQISPDGVDVGNILAPTVSQIANREPIDVRVEVDGQNYAVYVAGINDDMPLQSGSDPDLMPGKIGIQSWAQQIGPAGTFGVRPPWGTEVETVSVSDSSGTLFSGTFDGSSVLPVQWRRLVMTNSMGDTTEQAQSGNIGSFGADVRRGWILQRSNGFEWATTIAPNADFIGPAVVVDEPGGENFRDYEMRVRLGSRDDDGMGVLVRVQDEDNFYRVTFASEPLFTAPARVHERAPRGLSVQKVRDGEWTELFRDDQDNPLYIYPFPGFTGALNPDIGLPMFDLSVRAVGNTLAIQVIDEGGNVIDYPLIVDNDNPLLTGTVGLHTWGNEHTYFLPYGGVSGPLLTFIPEPTALGLALVAGLTLVTLRRRSRPA